jgi:acylphosphatase
MAYEISLTKRTNGGYTVVADGETWYSSELKYHGTDGGVILYDGRLNLQRYYLPDEWTIQTVSGYTTVVDVCDALDALGVLASDTLEDMEALLTTIDADTSAIKVAVELMDDDLDDARIALQVIDDWDESDRAKVNLIASQAGIDGNSGNKSDKTVRVVIATDQPALTNKLLVTEDNSASIKTAVEAIDNAVDGNYLNTNLNIAGTDVDANSGNKSAATLRVVIATDQPALTNKLLVTEDNSGSIKTAVELIDDTVKTLGTDTYAEATTKGLVVGAVRTDAETTLVNTTNEISPLSLSSVGRLKVESQGRTTAPVTLVATGTPQNVTTGWVDFGAEITTNGAHTLDLWTVVTHTNSVNVRVRILGKHTASTGAEFLVPIKTVSSSDVKVNGHYYELDSDATQNILIDWEVSGIPYVQVQIQCETVGVTADTVSADYTLMF